MDIKNTPSRRIFTRCASTLFLLFFSLLLLREFVIEPFSIPSGSMLPSLNVGDIVLVNKFAYGVKVPILNKIIERVSTPKRGDVLVFRHPSDPKQHYIKRVIGLPGDHIANYKSTLYINGVKIQRKLVAKYSDQDQKNAVEYTETLMEKKYAVLLLAQETGILSGEYIIPDAMYFVMGDNRYNSNDSRSWGPVPAEHLIGKAFMIGANFSDRWRFDRTGKLIQ